MPYNIDTGSEGNIMLLYIFKKIFKNTMVEELKQAIKNHIRLCTYNGTSIMQLGTCAVFIKFKNIRKCGAFFVVPSNGQVLTGMPDATFLDLIKVNIDSIQVEMSKGKTNNKQEMQTNADSCTNMKRDAINKQDANIQKGQDMPINPINYFASSSNIDADKRKSIKMTQIIHDKFGDVFNGTGCFKDTFSLQLIPDSRPYQAPPRHVAYALKNPSRKN